MLHRALLSTDYPLLLNRLAEPAPLLIVQDLDGVCMGLVGDPLSRRVDPAYLAACRTLAGCFFVLTNGEHVGRRGMNGIVERALGCGEGEARGHYLPGLAAGGVQWQDADGALSHPGVSAAEMAFLARVPGEATAFLQARLGEPPFRFEPARIAELAQAAVLDNRVSPTLNLNLPFAALRERVADYRRLQQAVLDFMRGQLRQAAAAGLGESFFVHLAPNLGRDEAGERLKPATGGDAGTTDFQLMLSGAIKEAGVLVLLNRWYAARYGEHPLGEDFNARRAPRGLDGLLALARERFDASRMPRIVGVGDTVTSHAGSEGRQRGGSDRGFLSLVQALGSAFGTDNTVLYVDSSGGEVRRPGLAVQHLPRGGGGIDWRAVEQISDADDPLRLNFVFPGGHRDYLRFLLALAGRR